MKRIYLLFLIFTNIFYGQQKDSIPDEESDKKLKVFYAKPGVQFQTMDGDYKMKLNFRVQFRGYLNFDADPTTIEDFQNFNNGINVNRARIKVGGNAYKPSLKYYFEYDIEGSNLLNFEFMIERWKFLKFRVGQWKSRYSVERMISSGNQQTLERSLINRAFTIDRQRGASVYGNLEGKGAANISYWASVFTGTGRGNRSNDDKHMMYMGRLQWNISGEEVKFTGSDLSYSDKFTTYIATAAVTNRSKYTRYSTSGGGFLEGFEDAEDGQYRVNQYLIEANFRYKGWYYQQEYHWKEIEDKIYDTPITHLTGHYAQLGYLIGQKINFLPKDFEVYGRHSVFNPNRELKDDLQFEYTVGLNWFIFGHNNKITAEYSYLDYESIDMVPNQSGSRYRLQWDISF